MTVVISNVGAMQAGNSMRQVSLKLSGNIEKLGSGLKVNQAADNPSGLAIGSGMTAQIRGITAAIQNVNDGISLIHTADSVLNEVQDILTRMRDLAVRGANEAALNGAPGGPNDDPSTDVRRIYKEILTIQTEIYRMATGHTFNGNNIFNEYNAGKEMQIGPDNTASNGVSVTIPNIQDYGIPTATMPPGDVSQGNFTDAFQLTIDNVTQNLADINDARASLGAQEKQLASTLKDLSNQYINISAARSNIMDTEMASEMVSFTKSQIILSSANIAAANSQINPQLVYELLRSGGLKT